jgi:hypothetical protein
MPVYIYFTSQDGSEFRKIQIDIKTTLIGWKKSSGNKIREKTNFFNAIRAK